MSRPEATAQANAVHAAIGRSGVWCALSLSVAVVIGLLEAQPPVAYRAASAAAVLFGIAVLASLRYYRHWLSWSVWLLPVVPIAIVLESLRIGTIAIGTAIFVYALAAGIMFGVFFVARDRLRNWVNSAF
jgi:hypothetical protein